MKFLNFCAFIGKSLGQLFSLAVLKPSTLAGIFIFRKLLVPLYKVYFNLKKWLTLIFAPAKNKIIYPLLNKSTIHIIIIIITVGVVINNIHVREIRAEGFEQNTIIASLTMDPYDKTITETAIDEVKKAATNRGLAMLKATDGTQSMITALSDENTSIITSESSGSLVKPELASTTLGNRPRESVEYYIVQGGDTISAIAEKFGISTNTILWENKLGPRDYIKPGDRLTILPQSGVSHQVKKGDTLDKIAQKYGVQVATIMDYNKLADASAINQDQILIIPGGSMPEEPKPQISSNSSKFAILSILDAPPPSRTDSGSRLLWPTTSHKINQYYKLRHTGLDIDGNYSSPIYAADDGRVERADSKARGYGLHIVVNNGSGIKTLYAHASKIFVRVGDSVKRGQTIGIVGCTGWCTGTHLHFEVIVNGKKVNPLTYL